MNTLHSAFRGISGREGMANILRCEDLSQVGAMLEAYAGRAKKSPATSQGAGLWTRRGAGILIPPSR